MFAPIQLIPALASGFIFVGAVFRCVAANTGAPELLDRCAQFHRQWTRYETAHCPNQTGQRAQAEWAFYRCQQGDFDRGLWELERLLRRDLIVVPPTNAAQ